MHLDRFLGDAQLRTDLLIEHAGGEKLRDFEFARRKQVEQTPCCVFALWALPLFDGSSQCAVDAFHQLSGF
jgi:hypothetical protein